MSVSGSKCLQFQFLDPESNLQYNKKEKYLAFTKPRPPWRIGTLKYLEIKIKKWPNRVRRGQGGIKFEISWEPNFPFNDFA